MSLSKLKLSEVRKAAVAVATLLSEALALGMLPTPYDKYALLVLGTLGAYGVYRVKNEPAA